MKKSTLIASAAIANILALGTITSTAYAVPAQPKNWEKCAGVAKAGKNDCGSLTKGGHSCAGQAASDNLDSEWVYVPEGTCAKLTGGQKGKVKPAKT